MKTLNDLAITVAEPETVGDILRFFDRHDELSGYAEAALRDPLGRILVAHVGGQLAGAIITRKTVDANRIARGGVDELLVGDEFRDRGVGRALMDAAESYWQREQGIAGMQLTVVASNDSAVHLYDSLGYREVQRRIRMQKDWSE